MDTPSVRIGLDLRNFRDSGRYPVSIIVTFTRVRGLKKVWHRKYYGHPAEKYLLTEKEFASFYAARSSEIRQIRSEFVALEAKAKQIIERYGVRTAYEFELYYIHNHNPLSIKSQFELKIRELQAKGQHSTAEKYSTALYSLVEFFCQDKIKKLPDGERNIVALFADHVSFYDCTPERLQDYEDWYTGRGGSLTSVGINLRHFRHIFNRAIKAKRIPESIYPFGEDKYVIPEGEGDGVKQYMETDYKDQFLAFSIEGQRAESYDYAVFIYYAHGMNPADVFRIRKAQDLGDHIRVSTRQKTRGKRKKKLKTYLIPVNDRMRQIIARRGTRSLDPNAYLFPVLSDSMSEAEKFRAVRNASRRIDAMLGIMARRLGWTFKPTIYTLRHTFSNEYMDAGATTEELQDALMHGSKRTTEIYKHGFKLQRKKRLSAGL